MLFKNKTMIIFANVYAILAAEVDTYVTIQPNFLLSNTFVGHKPNYF